MTIQNPITWGWDRLRLAVHDIGSSSPQEYWPRARPRSEMPTVRRIGLAELRNALAKGFEDFAANRTDVVFLCVFYPIVGLILGRLTFGYGLLPLLFPLAAGFALIGPIAAIGLNEMSRRRELGAEVNWLDAFGVLRSPSIGAITQLALLLIVLFVLWLMVAEAIYEVTLGPDQPLSTSAFIHDVLTTDAGWAMTAAGIGVGFLFAVAALVISVVSFPLLLDRPAGVETAVRTSVRVALANPGAITAWGLIIAVGLALGSIPFLIGLIVVMPVLGHAGWHLYRSAVAP